MSLKSRDHFPPGGFVFYEARTGWTSSNGIGFYATVQEIITHRKANPGRFEWATEPEAVAQELEAHVEARLRSTYGQRADSYLIGASSAPPNPLWAPRRPQPVVPGNAAGVSSTTRKVVSGVGTLIEWLGSGLKAVDQNTANARALICSTCPKNVEMEGLKKAVGTVGEFLHSVMSAKADLKLTTTHDDKLKQCSACLCHLAAKVWVPDEHIRTNADSSLRNELDPSCWQLKIIK